MKYSTLVLFAFISIQCAKQPQPKTLGDQSVSIFQDTNLYFDMALKENPSIIEDGTLRLDAGRVIVKKVTLPTYELQSQILVNMTLTSNGDPWDKAGSLFVIPKDAMINLLDLESKKVDISSISTTYPATVPFKKDSKTYFPNVELLRFMTPFGVGHFNDSERIKDRKPIYIPAWEDRVTWQQDITHLAPLLEGEVYIGVYIDTWTKEGYNISVSLDFDESAVVCDLKKKQMVMPLVNTIKYASDQRLYDKFSKEPLTTKFTLKKTVKNATLHYITTGHGGHGGGDEFVQRENKISLNGNSLLNVIPWRDDCASFRRFNPTSATWPANEIIPNETRTEQIASSDFSRSNWCPGSDVNPITIELKDLEAGEHTLTIAIPNAQAAIDTENNYWMVSAYLTYEDM